MTAILSSRGSKRMSLRCCKSSSARTSTDLGRRRQRLVPENGGARRAGGVASPAGDTACFTIVEGAIEIVAGIALTSVEHKERLARRARFCFEGLHQGAGDTLPPPLRMHEQLGDLPPVRAVLTLRGLELDSPHDTAITLRNEQDHSVSRNPCPPVTSCFRGQGRVEAQRCALSDARDQHLCQAIKLFRRK